MLFNESNVQILNEVKDWKDCIIKASMPLIVHNKVKKEYVKKMIESVENLGFYIVLTEDVVMPHARPEDGVLETSVSFLKLNKEVDFGEDRIKLIFVLAAKDKNEHIDLITELLDIFQDEYRINELKRSKNKKEIIKILKGGKGHD